MRYGSPMAAGWGSPDNHVAKIRGGTAPNGDAMAYVTGFSGFNDRFYQLYANDSLVSTFEAPSSTEVQVRVPARFGSQPFVAVVSCGHMNDPSYQMQPVARSMEENCPRGRLTWVWAPTSVDALDEEHTSNWVLSGLLLSQTTNWPGKKTWRSLDVAITVTGGSASITVSNQGTVLCSGSGSIPGTISLSGTVSGSVDCDAATATATAMLLMRWPYSMKVLRDASNPASTVVATVTNMMSDDQAAWAESSNLSAATYWYGIQPVSDTGEEGTATQLGSITVVAPLPAPIGTHYVIGDANAGIGVGFSIAAPWDDFVAFVSPPGSVLNTGASGYSNFSGFSGVSGSSVWYSGQGTLPSGAFVGYPGTYHALVRSFSGAYQSQNVAGLDLAIAADGSYQDPVPNSCAIDAKSVIVSNGLTLACKVAYQYQYSPFGTGYRILLAARTQTGAYDWALPIDSELLAPYDSAIALASLGHSFGASGTYYVASRAQTALGTMGPVSDEVLVQVSDEALTATGDLEQARG
jgi:hypothetical protein